MTIVYANHSRHELEFHIKDRIVLKISPSNVFLGSLKNENYVRVI